MGFIKDYAVPAIIGALISIFMDKIAVHYLKAVLRSERMLESLEKKIKTLNTVLENSLRIGEKCDGSSINCWKNWFQSNWNIRSQEIVAEASRMVEKHKGFSRLHYKLNIFSRHRRSKDIANLISDIDNHLKLFPVVQLACVLSLIISKRRLPMVLIGGGPGFSAGDFTSGTVGWVITAAFLVIFSYMGSLHNFTKKLASFQDLMKEFRLHLIYFGPMIDRIRYSDAIRNHSDNWLTPASNWVAEMSTIVTEGRGIHDTWSPIARWRKSKRITELISRIDAHLNELSWITLALLLHETEGPTGGRLLEHEVRMVPMTLTTSSQETLTPIRRSRASQERLTPIRRSRASRETEGSTSNAVPSYETERSTSHPTPPL